MEIKDSDKILIIAPHPDDEVIALGGFISKYHNQIDILCVNSSGVENKEKFAEKYDAFYKKYCYMEDGHASERIVDIMLNGGK